MELLIFVAFCCAIAGFAFRGSVSNGDKGQCRDCGKYKKLSQSYTLHNGQHICYECYDQYF